MALKKWFGCLLLARCQGAQAAADAHFGAFSLQIRTVWGQSLREAGSTRLSLDDQLCHHRGQVQLLSPRDG